MTFAKELREMINLSESEDFDCAAAKMEIPYFLSNKDVEIADLCETVSLYVNKINAPADHPLRVALGKLEVL